MFPFFLVFFCCHGNQMQQAKLAQACQAGETRCWFYQQRSLGSAEEPQDRPRVGLDPHPHLVLFTSHCKFLPTCNGRRSSSQPLVSQQQKTAHPQAHTLHRPWRVRPRLYTRKKSKVRKVPLTFSKVWFKVMSSKYHS